MIRTRQRLAALACAAAFAAPVAAQQQVTFMTRPQGGSWIPLGGALKNMWEQAVPGLQIQQTPGAGIANVRGVDEDKAQIGFDVVQNETGLAKVSVIGIGMRSHAGVAASAFKALAEKNINIKAITTSEIKISILIDGAYAELAVRTLHSAYGLDKS